MARQEALREEKRDASQRRVTLAQEFEHRVFNGLTAKGGCKCIDLTVRAREARALRTDLGLGGLIGAAAADEVADDVSADVLPLFKTSLNSTAWLSLRPLQPGSLDRRKSHWGPKLAAAMRPTCSEGTHSSMNL